MNTAWIQAHFHRNPPAPLELAHLLHCRSLTHGGVVLANLALVAILAIQLRQRLRHAPAVYKV